MTLQIKPLDQSNAAQAQAIIEAGLTQHWNVYDPSYNLDVSNLVEHYADRLLTFWLDDEMIGTGAWIVLSEDTIFFVRVSVLEKLQGQGYGTQIMELLEKHVKQLGYTIAELETTTTWSEVVSFYLKSGYTITHKKGEDTYFRKRL